MPSFLGRSFGGGGRSLHLIGRQHFCKILAVPRRLIFGSSLILMFLGILSAYFPRPVFGRPRAPIPAGTVSFLRPILETLISESLYFELKAFQSF